MEHRSDSAFDLGHVECVEQFSPSTEGLIQGDLGEDVSDSMVDLFLRQDLLGQQRISQRSNGEPTCHHVAIVHRAPPWLPRVYQRRWAGGSPPCPYCAIIPPWPRRSGDAMPTPHNETP